MEPHLEDVYEALARAIDAAGRDKETLLLAKVALLSLIHISEPTRPY